MVTHTSSALSTSIICLIIGNKYTPFNKLLGCHCMQINTQSIDHQCRIGVYVYTYNPYDKIMFEIKFGDYKYKDIMISKTSTQGLEDNLYICLTFTL